jgi:hypothetical protein
VNAPAVPNLLPAIPTRGTGITAQSVQQIEAFVIERVGLVDDVGLLNEFWEGIPQRDLFGRREDAA